MSAFSKIGDTLKYAAGGLAAAVGMGTVLSESAKEHHPPPPPQAQQQSYQPQEPINYRNDVQNAYGGHHQGHSHEHGYTPRRDRGLECE